MPKIDFAILQHPSTPEFISELEKVHMFLPPNQTQNFYNAIFKHFKSHLNEGVGQKIMRTVRDLIQLYDFRVTFVKDGFISSLPFQRKMYFNDCLDILLDLLKTTTDPFDSKFVENFSPNISFNPNRVLSLIAFYSQKFDDISNPWPFLDMLFEKSRSFTSNDLLQDYLDLLIHLCYTYTEYRSSRVLHCWFQICNFLDLTETNSLVLCYKALNNLISICPNGDLPLEIMKNHILDEKLADQVLSVFAQKDTSKFDYDNDLVTLLFITAKQNPKAVLLLMKIANSESGAEKISNCGNWIVEKLPTTVDTLRLFLVVSKNNINIRNKIVQSRSFIRFLKNLVDEENVGCITVINTILRRIELDIDFVKALSNRGFLLLYFKASQNLNDSAAMNAALLTADAIAKVRFVPELIDFCDVVAEIAMNQKDELQKIACIVAADMSAFKKCRIQMSKKGLDKFMKSKKDDITIGKCVKRFLNHFKE